jgi:hypothetical protein
VTKPFLATPRILIALAIWIGHAALAGAQSPSPPVVLTGTSGATCCSADPATTRGPAAPAATSAGGDGNDTLFGDDDDLCLARTATTRSTARLAWTS